MDNDIRDMVADLLKLYDREGIDPTQKATRLIEALDVLGYHIVEKAGDSQPH